MDSFAYGRAAAVVLKLAPIHFKLVLKLGILAASFTIQALTSKSTCRTGAPNDRIFQKPLRPVKTASSHAVPIWLPRNAVKCRAGLEGSNRARERLETRRFLNVSFRPHFGQIRLRFRIHNLNPPVAPDLIRGLASSSTIGGEREVGIEKPSPGLRRGDGSLVSNVAHHSAASANWTPCSSSSEQRCIVALARAIGLVR